MKLLISFDMIPKYTEEMQNNSRCLGYITLDQQAQPFLVVKHNVLN
jgi:hypothetical protein